MSPVISLSAPTQSKVMPSLKRRLFRSLCKEEGATLVETALTSIVLLCLLLGVIEMSYAVYAYDYVSEAAREATRYAMVRGATSCTNTPSLSSCGVTGPEIQTYVQSLGYPGFNSSNLTVSTTWCAASTSGSPPTTSWPSCSATTPANQGSLVKVVATYAFPMSIPFWNRKTINVSSTSQMVVAQ